LYAIVLRKGDASQLPREGETPPEAASGTTTTIDFDGIADRIVPLPTGGATLRSLQAARLASCITSGRLRPPAINALNSPGELKRFVMKERAAQDADRGLSTPTSSRPTARRCCCDKARA
jgi:hypothetical protein